MSAGAKSVSRGLRLRCFNKANLLSWLFSLEANGHALCCFQNCFFLALDIDEMSDHYSYCNQELHLSEKCELCGRACSDDNKLLMHKVIGHPDKTSFQEMVKFHDLQNSIIPQSKPDRKVSCAMRRFWSLYLSQKMYLKCLVPTCFYVTQSLEDMEKHYKFSCTPEERNMLNFYCSECFGRFKEINDLESHLKEIHPSKTFTKHSVSPNLFPYWAEVLQEFAWAKCINEQCNFIDCSIKSISAHYTFCTNSADGFVRCNQCFGWLLNGQKLVKHMIDVHNPLSDKTNEFIERCFKNSYLQLQGNSIVFLEMEQKPLDCVMTGDLQFDSLDEEEDKEFEQSLFGAEAGSRNSDRSLLKVLYERNSDILPSVYSRKVKQLSSIPNPITTPSNVCLDSSEDSNSSAFESRLDVKPNINQIAANLGPCYEAPVVPVNISTECEDSWTLHVPQAPPPNELQGLPSFEKRFWDNVLLEMEDLIGKAASYTSIRNTVPHYKKCSTECKVPVSNHVSPMVTAGIDYAPQYDCLDRINYRLPEFVSNKGELPSTDSNNFLISEDARPSGKSLAESLSMVLRRNSGTKSQTVDCTNMSLTAKNQPSNDSTVSSSNSHSSGGACDNSQGNSSHNSPPSNDSSGVVNVSHQMLNADSSNSTGVVSDNPDPATSITLQNSFLVDTVVVKEEPIEVSESEMILCDPLNLPSSKSNGKKDSDDEGTLDVGNPSDYDHNSTGVRNVGDQQLSSEFREVEEEQSATAGDGLYQCKQEVVDCANVMDWQESSNTSLNSVNDSVEMDETTVDKPSRRRRKSRVVRKLNHPSPDVLMSADDSTSEMFMEENSVLNKSRSGRKRKAETIIPLDLPVDTVMDARSSKQKPVRLRRCQTSSQYILPDGSPFKDEDPIPVEVWRPPMRKRKSTSASEVLNSLGPRVTAGSELKDPKEMVTCFVCKEKMPVKMYQSKHVLTHTFICWLEGEKPLPEDDYPAMTLYLNRWKKIYPTFPLSCPKCSVVKKSAVGFISHYQFCGRTSEEVNSLKAVCPVCTRMFKPSNIDQHLQSTHVVRSDVPIEPVVTLKKRKSTYRNQSADSVATMLSESDEILPSDLVDTNIASAPTEDYNVLKQQWKDALAKDTIIICPFEGCDFAAGTLPEIRKHYKTCSSNGGLQPFICKECNFKAPTRDALKLHVKKEHSQNQAVQPTPSEIVCPIPALKEVEDQLYTSFSYLRQSSFFRPAMQWTAELRAETYTRDLLFPDMVYLTNAWSVVNDPKTYVCTLDESVMMKFESSEWNRLQLYGTLSEPGSSSCIFTGGPVTAMAWVPTPDGSLHEQYLAVACQLKPGQNYEIGQVYAEPSVIQLWSYGLLVNNRNREMEPKLVSSLCVDGCVWDLSWCPSGCYDDRRIGVLATALSTGEVHIFAAPHAHQLPSIEFPMHYSYKPQMKLLPRANDISQCKRVGWAKVKPHNLVVGGFGNGMVGVWNLSVTSTLLRKGSELYPCIYFKAHHSIVTGISMCPVSNNFLLTAAMDRNVHLWDLRAVENPLQSVNKGTYTDVDWLSHWVAFVSASDAGYVNATSTGLCSSVRDFSFLTAQILNSYAATSTSISASDWINAAAFSHEDGNVVGMLGIRQMGSGTESTKKRTKYIVQCKLTRLAKAETKKKLLKSSSTVQDVPTDSSSYEETASMFGLHFTLSRRVEDSLKHMKNPEDCRYDVYSIQCANKVCFNPNVQSFLSLAVGYESGFVLTPSLLMPSNSITHVNSFTPES